MFCVLCLRERWNGAAQLDNDGLFFCIPSVPKMYKKCDFNVFIRIFKISWAPIFPLDQSPGLLWESFSTWIFGSYHWSASQGYTWFGEETTMGVVIFIRVLKVPTSNYRRLIREFEQFRAQMPPNPPNSSWLKDHPWHWLPFRPFVYGKFLKMQMPQK